MIDQLLWLNALLLLPIGILFLVLPKLIINLLGLPKTQQLFYPRVIGGLSFGMGLASMIEGGSPGSTGLGLGGAVTIGLSIAVVLLSSLLFGRTKLPRRGRLLLWLCIGVLVVGSATEFVYVQSLPND